jgi:very-short-patch-repair endonuclease
MPGQRRPTTRPVTGERARALRRSQTPPEAKLWDCLRGCTLCGLKFRRQCPVGPFVADFCCLEERLIIELDGPSHEGQQAHDAARTAWLAGHGFRVLRFTNEEVLTDREAVARAIAQACGRQT